jgi:hypothetical protein
MAIVEDVQARLDSYKTNKQRIRRFKELQRIGQREQYISLELAIEAAALQAILQGILMTAQRTSDEMRAAAAAGELRLHVNIDGDHHPMPAKIFRKPH